MIVYLNKLYGDCCSSYYVVSFLFLFSSKMCEILSILRNIKNYRKIEYGKPLVCLFLTVLHCNLIIIKNSANEYFDNVSHFNYSSKPK